MVGSKDSTGHSLRSWGNDRSGIQNEKLVVDVCGEVRMVEKGGKKEKDKWTNLVRFLEQLPFPGNGAEKLVGYFKRTQRNPQAHGYRCSFHPGVFQSIDFHGEREVY